MLYRPGTGGFTPAPFDRILLGEHNSARLPGYFRLDISMRKEYDKSWFGGIKVTPYLQIINVLNTRNVLFAEPTQPYFGSDEVMIEYLPQLPFLPTFGVEWRF